MTSEYFSNKNNFDQIKDPLKEYSSDYWYFNTKEESEMICWNDNIFTDQEIRRIKVIGKRLGCKQSLVGFGSGKSDTSIRNCYNSWIKPNEYTNWIFERVSNILLSNNEKFFQFDLTMLECIQFTYYSSEMDGDGGHYKSHIDSCYWNLPHNRKLSMVIQLSSPDEYEGGDLLIQGSYNPSVVRKEKSFGITFPAFVLHEVTPVTKGERYTLVAWAHGPSFK